MHIFFIFIHRTRPFYDDLSVRKVTRSEVLSVSLRHPICNQYNMNTSVFNLYEIYFCSKLCLIPSPGLYGKSVAYEMLNFGPHVQDI